MILKFGDFLSWIQRHCLEELITISVMFGIFASGVITLLGQSQDAPRAPASPYASLDRQADAKDSKAIRSLFLEIHARTLSGPMPESILKRLVNAQQAFLNGTNRPVTEATVATAINTMGRELDATTYTGTNALQVRLLRIHYLPSMGHLLASPSPRPPDQIVANDLTPAGAMYLGLLLLRQKLSNPAWFGDPEMQNKIWLQAQPAKPSTESKTILRVENEASRETSFRLLLEKGFANEKSTTTKAYHHFLDSLGFKK